MLLGMNVGYENEKKEEFKMIHSEDSCSYMGVGGRRETKMSKPNQIFIAHCVWQHYFKYIYIRYITY